MMPHVRAGTLARFRDGDLSARRNSRVRAHLGRCARCRALNDDLAGVTALLASVDQPPMPGDVLARIQAALATEAAQRVAVSAGDGAIAQGTGAPAPAEPGDAGRPRHDRPRHGAPRREGLRQGGPRHAGRAWSPRLSWISSPAGLRTAAAAAAAVVIAGGIYAIVGHPATSPHAGSSAAGPFGGHILPAQPAFGPSLRYRHGAQQASVTPISTNTDFTAGKLRSQVTEQMTAYRAGSLKTAPLARGAQESPGPSSAPANPRTFGSMAVSALDGCVNRVAAGQLVLLVDVALYQGSRATIIVTGLAVSSPGEAWVVGPGCSASRTDMLAHEALTAGG